jgi:hypothetical protein
VDPLLYRLWSLPPLQTQLVRRGEMILEGWIRPTGSVRQGVIRITLRGDGKAFVQGRAGLGCCAPRIGRLVAFDEPLPADRAAALRGLVDHPMWSQPQLTEIAEADGSASALCVDGVAWDLTLVTRGASRRLHRACLGEEIGSIADALGPLVAAALGQDPRFDLLFPRGADFSRETADYQALLARGGRLKAARANRPQPPPLAIPLDEAAPAPDSPAKPQEGP